MPYHLWVGHDGGESHGDGQLALVPDHGDELDEALEAVGQRRLGQRLELRALLQDLRQHLHEGRPRLGVLVVPQRWNRWF